MALAHNQRMSTPCVVYRCSRQADLYLYLRADLEPARLPEPLLKRAGQLTEVMRLDLHAERRLARVDVSKVIEQLRSAGYFLQLPPNGLLDPHLYFGD